MSVPNEFEIVRKLFTTGVFNLKTHEGQGAFTDAVVSALHAKDERWGHLKKSPAQTNEHGHGEDAALYLSEEDGQSIAVDFIGGAGGPNPQPAWQEDQPRYSKKDWLDPTLHGSVVHVPVPAPPVYPPYPGDHVFDQVGITLFADYAAAGQSPNPQMGRWFGRVMYDWLATVTPTLEASIVKHRAEWVRLLGLPS